MYARILVLCLMGFCVAPLSGRAETAPEEAPSDPSGLAEDVVLDEATFAALEQQFEALDALIQQQTRQLELLYDKMAVETDSTKQQQLDSRISRLTQIVDEFEYQRDVIAEKIEILRRLSQELRAVDQE